MHIVTYNTFKNIFVLTVNQDEVFCRNDYANNSIQLKYTLLLPARQFSASCPWMHLRWTCLKLTRNISNTSCEVLLPRYHWNTHPSLWLDCFSTAKLDDDKFTIGDSLHVSNTLFKKRNPHLITDSSGGDSSKLDYILYHRSFNSTVSDMEVIPNKTCIDSLTWCSASLPLNCPVMFVGSTCTLELRVLANTASSSGPAW